MRYIINVRNIWELGQRSNQEDSLFPAHDEAQENDRLFILCDGMGGHSSGEVASAAVCNAMSQWILNNCPDSEGEFTDEDFREALNAAYDALDNKDSNNEGRKKMGTTMTFLKLHKKGCTIAHIGDSRVYHIRPGKDIANTQILFQTLDHSLVNDLIKVGELTPEEAKTSSVRNVITRAMQPHMEHRSKADIYHTDDIQPGDYFMLCSDGILEQFEDEQIKFYFSDSTGGNINDKVNKLTLATENNHDNHTAIVIQIVDVIDPVSRNNNEKNTLPNDIIVDIKGNDAITNDNHQTPITHNNNNNNNNNNTTTHPISFDNKQIAIATALLIIIIALFLLFKGCENKRNNGEIVTLDSIEMENMEPREEIKPKDKELEKNQLEEQSVQEKNSKTPEVLEKEKGKSDSIASTTDITLKEDSIKSIKEIVEKSFKTAPETTSADNSSTTSSTEQDTDTIHPVTDI